MARMNDPWNVKCVRQAGQYVSCMKINGMPLLPPVLSKECRKEMQYYKLLAREVEKRISQLQPFLRETDSESSEDKTDAPELPECEQNFEVPYEEEKTDFNSKHLKKSVDPLSRHTTSSRQARPLARNARCLTTDVSKNITSNVVVGSKESCSRSNSPKLIIDLSVNINESGKNVFNVIKRARSPAQIDLPERDYNCTTRITQKVTTEEKVTTETKRHRKHKNTDEESTNFSFKLNKNNLEESITDNLSVSQDGHTTLSSKSFTGSLNDLHRDSVKDLQHTLPLVRQRSYTLLNPSPQLLAHLEVQSLNTGIEMSSISMSESLSNISCSKKRRSWDLESAKVKWSSMALELNQTGTKRLKRNASNKCFMKQQPKNSSPTIHSTRAKSVAPEKTRPSICFGSAITPKPMPRSNQVPNSDSPPKSEPKPRKYSPVRNTNNRSLAKDPGSPKSIKKLDLSTQSHAPSSILNSENPAAHVRELYEKIQQQQLLQMQTLVEKQKKEQMLLQQVFEEQNSLLFKQLKSICPTSPIEVKEAWGDKHPEQGQAGDRGPVSLSQLINYKSPDQSSVGSPVSTLTNTNNYINVCDNVLKKSRDITGSIKKQPIKTHTQNGTKNMPPRTQTDGYRTRTQSPKSPVSPNSPKSSRSPQRNTATSRRLTYETSVSTDRDYEPLLTDRTNDTMADLNVTFPSDNDDDFGSQVNNSVVSHIFGKEIKTIHATAAMHNSSAAENAIRHMEKTIHANTAVHNSSAAENAIRSMEETIHATTTIHNSSAENAIRHMEQTIYESMNSINSLVSKAICKSVTPREQAAATKIVAWAKGYLVRRLMRTDRVQATVQTIKDALLCALQLHQDREGIRGADVDLHRRLIQQITAACYSLHDTFVASTAAERCAMIAADRERRRSLAARQANGSIKQTNLMSQSHTGAFPARTKRPSTSSLMTQSNYETFSEGKRAGVSVSRHMASPHRRPWR